MRRIRLPLLLLLLLVLVVIRVLLALLLLDFSGQRWRTLEVGVTVLPCIRGTRCSVQGLSVRVRVCWGVGVLLWGSLVSGGHHSPEWAPGSLQVTISGAR